MPLTFTDDDFAEAKAAQPHVFTESDFAEPTVKPKADLSKMDLKKIEDDDKAARAFTEGAKSSDFLRAVTDPQTGLPAQAGKAMTYAGNVAKAIPADVAETIAGNEKYYELKNLAGAALGEEPQITSKISESAQDAPVAATVAKLGQSAAAMIPLAATASLPAAAQKLVALGFSAQMIAGAGQAATDLGSELGKKPEDRDMDKLTTAVSELSQTALFAPLAAKHGLIDAVEGKVRPKDYVIRKLAEELNKYPTLPSVAINPKNPVYGDQLNTPKGVDVAGKVPETVTDAGLREPMVADPNLDLVKLGNRAPETTIEGNPSTISQPPSEVQNLEVPKVETPPTEAKVEKVAETPAKEPWQMSREEYVKSEGGEMPPIETQALDAISNRNDRKPYNPDLITSEAVEFLKKAGLIKGSKNFKLTSAGIDAIYTQRRFNKDAEMKRGDAFDNHPEIVEKALSEGKEVPSEVLEDYPDLVKKAEKPSPPPEQPPIVPTPPVPQAESAPANKIAPVAGKSPAVENQVAIPQPNEPSQPQVLKPVSNMKPKDMVDELHSYGFVENPVTGKLVKNMDANSLRLSLLAQRRSGAKPLENPTTPPVFENGQTVMVTLTGKKWQKATVVQTQMDGSAQVRLKDGTFTTITPEKIANTTRESNQALNKGQFEGVSKKMQETVKANEKQFYDLVQSEGPRFGWYDAEHDTAVLKSQGFEKSRALMAGVKKAFKEAGIEGDPENPFDLSKGLMKFKKYVKENAGKELQKADFKNTTADGKIEVTADELVEGDVLDIDGEMVKVKSKDNDSGDVILEDGRRFGVQKLESGNPIYVERLIEKQHESAPEAKVQDEGKADWSSQEMGGDVRKDLKGDAGGSATAMKYKKIDAERAQRGLPPIVKPESVSDQALMDKAMGEIDRNNDLPTQLVDSLLKNPRTIEAWERMVLLLRKIDLRENYERATRDAAQAYDDMQSFPDRKAEWVKHNLEANRLSDELTNLEKASRLSGSETGRALRALQIMANEDYSLAGLERGMRQARNGEPITADERVKLQKIADDYAKANAELQTQMGKSKQAELAAKNALDEIVRQTQPKYHPKVLQMAEDYAKKWDARADKAMKEIQALLSGEGQAMSILNPDLVDAFAVYSIGKIVRGATDSAKWAAEMTAKFGEKFEQYKDAAWKRAHEMLDEDLNKVEKSFGAAAKQVRKAIKDMSSTEKKDDVVSKIGKRISKGENDRITSLVQKLARLIVEDGVLDRDELVTRVHDHIKAIDPTITRDKVVDMISGYGDFKQLSKDATSVQLRDFKRQLQIVAALRDMEAGQPPLRSGRERTEWTEEQGKLMKELKKAKFEFQVPLTDPARQLKSALDEAKTRLERQIADYQERIATGDFAKRVRPELVIDRKTRELQAKRDGIVMEFKRLKRKAEMASRTKYEKAMDFASNLRRFSVLSGAHVLAKLAAYSATKLPTMGVTEAIGNAYAKLPYLSQIAAKAPSEGATSLATFSRATAKMMTQGMVDAYNTATKGGSEIKKGFSDRLDDGYEWWKIPQILHEVIKSPLRRAAFELSLAKRIEHGARNGVDVTDPTIQILLQKDAYLDSSRALLLENNKFANWFTRSFKEWESKDKNTGEVPRLKKFLVTVGRIEMPILTVPFNYAKQSLVAAFGSISGAVKARDAFRRGIDTLKPEEADSIMRHLKYGSVGGAMLLYGFYDGYNNGANGTFGGFYQPGEKRKENQLGVNGMQVAGYKIPGFLLHNPVLAVGQLGHTIGAVMRSKISKKNPKEKGITAGVLAGANGLLNESPIGRQVEFISSIGDPRSAGHAWGNHAKGILIPQLMNEVSQWTDRDAQGNVIKRDPKTTIQFIETGVPGLRQQVPMKAEKPAAKGDGFGVADFGSVGFGNASFGNSRF